MNIEKTQDSVLQRLAGGEKKGWKRTLHQVTMIFGALCIGVGLFIKVPEFFGSGGSGAIDSSFTPDEAAVLEKIKNSKGVDDVMGHDISQNTKLYIVRNVGQSPKCGVQIQGNDDSNRLINSNWNLVVLLSKDGHIVYTNNSSGQNGGSVQISFSESGHQYILDKNSGGSGRAIELNAKLLKDLQSNKKVIVTSGMVLGTEFNNSYDLTVTRQALKYANALCLKA